MPAKPAVFLDRDNTIIRNDGDLGDPARIELMQGAAMAIASLCGLGFKVVVVTNQGGVARGRYTEEDVDAVHDRLREMIETAANGARIEAFYFCPYHPQGTVPEYTREHADRKPQPGMLLRAAEEHGLDLARSWMVGDALRDVQAGGAAGCRTVWIDTFAKPDDVPGEDDTPDYTAGSLVEAVRIIGSQRHTRDEPRRAEPGPVPMSAHVAQLDRSPPTRSGEAGEHGPVSEPSPKAEAARPDAKPAVVEPPAAQPASTRPFRPFALPPTDPPPAPPAEPRAKVRLAEMVSKVKAVSAALRDESPCPSSSQGPAPAESEPVHPADADASPQGATYGEREPAPPASLPVDPPPPGRSAPSSRGVAEPEPQHKLLRLILQELRGQRGRGDHTNAGTIVAMVLQAIAGVCLLGGLWMGAGDDGLFLRWLGAAVIVQLAVIALLLFGRSDR